MNGACRILAGALARVKRGWCQYASAVDMCNRLVAPESMAACKWCVSGAMVAAKRNQGASAEAWLQARDALRAALIGEYGPQFVSGREGDIPRWNDAAGRTQDDAIALVRAAIKRAEALGNG